MLTSDGSQKADARDAPRKTWFLVTKTWHVNYWGLCGDCWPLDCESGSPHHELHSAYEASREYVRGPGGTVWYVCTDKNIARRYYQAAVAVSDGVALLELAFEDQPDALGFDYGCPEGGYSIVVDEMRYVSESLPRSALLNDRGLFRSRQGIDDYLTLRRSFQSFDSLEYVDEYETVSIRLATPVQLAKQIADGRSRP